MEVAVYVEYYDQSGEYYGNRFTSYSRYTKWLDSNRGVRVMKVEVQ